MGLTGKTFGRLTVIEPDEIKSKSMGRKYYICQCSCKNKTILSVRADVLGKRTNSCGCLQKEIVSQYCKNNYTKENRYEFFDGYGVGHTINGESFLFDSEDFDIIKNRCWHIDKNGYVVCRKINGETLMHRLILADTVKKSDIVDHINHKTFDNRKCNLRITTQQRNCFNQSVRKNNKSGVSGVMYSQDKHKWVARITYSGKNIHLGYYKTKDEAVIARQEAEEKYFGEYSYKNSIEKGI